MDTHLAGGSNGKSAKPIHITADAVVTKPRPQTMRGRELAERIERNIPAELKAIQRWVGWRWELDKNGRWTKPPKHIGGKWFNDKTQTWVEWANHTDPKTWSTYEKAIRALARADSTFDGIGIVFSADDDLIGVDVDHIIGHPISTQILDKFAGTYCERSPSGKLHALCYGKIERSRRQGKTQVEVYDKTRFFTVTGDYLDASSRNVTTQQSELEWLIKTFIPDDKPAHQVRPAQRGYIPASGDIIDMACSADGTGDKFAAIYGGNWKPYFASQSEADLYLCSRLAFWTGNNPDEIDRLFRGSGLSRGKWVDRDDYREETINKAVSECRETYSGGRERARHGTNGGSHGNGKDSGSSPPRSYDQETGDVHREIAGGEPLESQEASEDATEADSSDDDNTPKAIVSARRAALNGDSKEVAVRRIQRQWSDINARSIVDDAWAWVAARSTGQRIKYDGSLRRVVDICQMNAQYALLTTAENPACVILRESAMPISREDFHLRNAASIVVTGVKDSGEAVVKDAAKHWMTSDDKHRYKRVVFTSKKVNDPEVMNLFTGFGVEPRHGDWSRIRLHIHEVICAGNTHTLNHFLNLVAWQSQNIGLPSRIIPTLVQEKQQVGGKNIILEDVFLKMYGRAGRMTSNMDDVIGTFNSGIRGKAYVFLDEALFAGDHSGADRIKSLATLKTLTVNEKNIPKVAIPSGLNLWLTSNHEIPVKVEEHDARYWFLQPSDHRKGDRDYFSALLKEINSGGVEAFLYSMLMERDVNDFMPHYDIPRRNELHKKMVRGNIPIGDPRLWLEMSVECEMLMGVEWNEEITDGIHERTIIRHNKPWVEGDSIAGGDFMNGYRYWLREQSGYGKKSASPAKIWESLNKAGFVADDRTKRNNFRKVPNLEECAAMVQALFDVDSTST